MALAAVLLTFSVLSASYPDVEPLDASVDLQLAGVVRLARILGIDSGRCSDQSDYRSRAKSSRTVALSTSQTTPANLSPIIPMRCPVCKREFETSTSTALPFCSERCRTIDLGRWLGETYSLPVAPDPEADETLGAGSRPNGNGASGQPS